MKKTFLPTILAMFVCICVCAGQKTAYAASYYLSALGSDAAAGNSPISAWQTIDRLNRQNLKAGDKIYFRSGDRFFGSILVKQSGTKKKPIVFGSYGKGDLPLICGAALISNWQATNGFMEASCPVIPQNFYINNRLQTIARSPNSGWNTITKGVGATRFIDTTYKNIANGRFAGASIRYRQIDWTYNIEKIVNNRSDTFEVRANMNRSFNSGYGYFLDNKAEFLDTAGEWYYEPKSKMIRYISANNQTIPALAEVSSLAYGMKLAPYSKFITVENLHFSKFDSAAIRGANNCNTVIISKNQITQNNIYGIRLDSGSLYCKIISNDIKDILGRGISVLEGGYTLVEDNEIKNIGIVPGYGWNGVNGASGLLFENIENRTDTLGYVGHHNVARYNRIDSVGYVGIRFDGHSSVAEYNLIKNCMLTLADGSGMYCWGGRGKNTYRYTYDNIWRKNVIMYSRGSTQATTHTSAAANGFYVDNKCKNIRLEGNIAAYISNYAGYVINDQAPNNTIVDNLAFGCKEGIVVSEWASVNKTNGQICKRNTFVQTEGETFANSTNTFMQPGLLPYTVCDSNRYVCLKTEFIGHRLSSPFKGMHRRERLEPAIWQSETGYDKNSYFLTNRDKFIESKTAILLVNTERKTKRFALSKDKKYYTIDKKAFIAGFVDIKPFESFVLLAEI